jgi:hypothetical protein
LWPSTVSTNFKVLMPVSVSFKLYRFIPINSFKHFVCFCSCFSEFETKLHVRSLSNDNKDNQLTRRAAMDELSYKSTSLIHGINMSYQKKSITCVPYHACATASFPELRLILYTCIHALICLSL